jgi:hypothetical protein
MIQVLLSLLGCSLLPAQSLAGGPTTPAPSVSLAPPAALPTPATSPWPADQAALEAMLPSDALGASTPLQDELDGGAYGTSWKLTKLAMVVDVPCTKQLDITYDGFACTIGAPYTAATPKVTLKAGSLVTFDYGSPRLNYFTVADLEPATKRVVVNAIPCTEYVLLEDGKFARCVLAEDRAFGSLVIPGGSDVLSMLGQLQVVAGRAFEAEGQLIPSGGLFTAEPSGKLIHVFEDGEGAD